MVRKLSMFLSPLASKNPTTTQSIHTRAGRTHSSIIPTVTSNMKSVIVAFIFTVLAIATTSHAFFLHEESAPDGVYTHYIDSNGTAHSVFVAPLSKRAVRRSLAERVDYGVQCQDDVQMNSDDASASTNSLANIFDDGFLFFKTISAKSGSAVTYGCDYGHGQSMTSDQLFEYMTDVATECGSGSAGYFNVPQSKASFGRTNVGIGFC